MIGKYAHALPKNGTIGKLGISLNGLAFANEGSSCFSAVAATEMALVAL